MLQVPFPFAESAHRLSAKYANEISALLQLHERQARYREVRKLPAIGIVGRSQCGKDLAGQLLAQQFGLLYNGSLSKAFWPMVKEAMADADKQCDFFADRHTQSKFWFHWMNAFRSYQGSWATPTKMALARGDFAIGIRSYRELSQCVVDRVIDQLIWVERGTAEPDHTLEFDKEDVVAMGGTVVINSGVQKSDLLAVLVEATGAWFPK